jgi:hypothetical protein
MRPTVKLWAGVIGCTIVVSVWAVLQLAQSPLLSSHRTPAATAEILPAAAVAPPVDVTGGRHWADPSLDPKVLAKAYAPAPANLPPEARPKPLRITPSAKEMRRLEQEGATAY